MRPDCCLHLSGPQFYLPNQSGWANRNEMFAAALSGRSERKAERVSRRAFADIAFWSSDESDCLYLPQPPVFFAPRVRECRYLFRPVAFPNLDLNRKSDCRAAES